MLIPSPLAGEPTLILADGPKPTLLAKSQWTPHPALPTELTATVSKFV